MKPKFYYLELFKMNFYFCIGWTPDQFESYASKQLGYPAKVGCFEGKAIFIENEDERIIVIWIKKRNMLSCLAHECVHAANFVMEHVGIKAQLDNDEVQAYLVEHIFDKALSTNKKVKH